MKILTSLFVGTCMLVGSALAAQSNPAPKPATSTPATQSAQKTVHTKKHRTHKKATTSKKVKKNAPVSAVAMKKKPAAK